MTKQYEIRTKDLKFVVDTLESTEQYDAYNNYKYRLLMLPEYSDTVLALHTFETDAEADRDRLDWLDNNGWPYTNWPQQGSLRVEIDAARQAPQPKVSVIATPEGVV